MNATITKEANSRELTDFIDYLKETKLPKEIVAKCQKIFPLDNVYIRKVKILKAAKIDSLKLLDQHQTEAAPVQPVVVEEQGEKVDA